MVKPKTPSTAVPVHTVPVPLLRHPRFRFEGIHPVRPGSSGRGAHLVENPTPGLGEPLWSLLLRLRSATIEGPRFGTSGRLTGFVLVLIESNV